MTWSVNSENQITFTEKDKSDTLFRLICYIGNKSAIVFCNHRDAVDRISQLFKNNKFEHGIFHGALEQIDREKNLIKFRGGAHNVLISTDLAARGLDIDGIAHVVNYEVPDTPEAYVHRVGRTGRAESTGNALTLVAPEEIRALRALEKAVGVQLQ